MSSHVVWRRREVLAVHSWGYRPTLPCMIPPSMTTVLPVM